MTFIYYVIGIISAVFCVSNSIDLYLYYNFLGWDDDETKSSFGYVLLYLGLFIANLFLFNNGGFN